MTVIEKFPQNVNLSVPAESKKVARVPAAKKKRETKPQQANAAWWDSLVQDGSGPAKNLHNVIKVLRASAEFRGSFAWNTLSQNFMLTRETPAGGPGPGSDQAICEIANWIQSHGFNVGVKTVMDGVFTEARRESFHPVRDYLESLEWDGIPRIDEWLHAYAGADLNAYTKAVGSKWLISAVARAYQPGCKADCMLVLEGEQGTGKSTTFAVLGGEFFSDQISDFRDKDSSMEATRWWIIEHAELDSLSRSEAAAIKAFISRQSERFRLPYGRVIEDVPRSCIFCGTVNPDAHGYLRDATGGRRFWPVAVVGEMQTECLKKDRDQLWAEAVWRYKQGIDAKEPYLWWLTPAEDSLAREEQDERFASDVWEDAIRQYVLGREALGEDVTTAGILVDCLGIPLGNKKKSDEITIGLVMSKLGYRSTKVGTRTERKRVYRKRR